MKSKQIGNLERVLISECVRENPDFGKINKLFDIGANINAVNEFGESTAAIVFEGYCSLYGDGLRSGYYAPILADCFIKHGFDTKKHGLKTISELQNGCYDRYIRQAIYMILKNRKEQKKQSREVALKYLRQGSARLVKKLTTKKTA